MNADYILRGRQEDPTVERRQVFPHCLGIARTSERGTRDLAMACAIAGVQLVDARCSNWSWRTWRRWLPQSLAPNRSANPDPSGASRALCEPLASPGQLGTRCPVLPDIHPVRLPRPMTPSLRGNPLVSCHHPPLVECCAEALLPRQGTAPGTHRYTPTHLSLIRSALPPIASCLACSDERQRNDT